MLEKSWTFSKLLIKYFYNLVFYNKKCNARVRFYRVSSPLRTNLWTKSGDPISILNRKSSPLCPFPFYISYNTTNALTTLFQYSSSPLSTARYVSQHCR